MQSPSGSRSQRPYPGDPPLSPPPQYPLSGSDPAMASQSGRSSSASARPGSSKSAPDKQISQIEKSVTHLLVATKQLLETLTQWSRKQASENDVSDVYVRLGYEFNLACRAFNAISVDTSDLGPVPDLLRTILEDTLSQDASPQSLDRYLPRIRDIIVNLLQGLKKKQARLRSRQQREEGRPAPGRHASAGHLDGPPNMGQLYDETAASVMPPAAAQSPRRSAKRYGSNGSLDDQHAMSRASPGPSPAPVSGDGGGGSFSEREASRRETQQLLTQSSPTEIVDSALTPRGAVAAPNTPAGFPAPPPPPKQDDALGALQRSGELERRASRRFSAYQIQKHLGPSTNGVPVLPTQSSPIPNRGRDVRESLNAVRLRGSYTHTRQQSSIASKSGAAQAAASIPDPVVEEQSKVATEPPSATQQEPAPELSGDQSTAVEQDNAKDTTVQTPQLDFPQPPTAPAPLGDVESGKPKTPAVEAVPEPETPKPDRLELSTNISTPQPVTQFVNEQPSPGKELTLFLQYKSKIKKYVIPEGAAELTIGRLQLAFIEKFAWNTHNNGADLPEIYIQDPISGIRHELEDLSDVKDRSVLVLNVDTLDEVKKHFDDGFGSMRLLFEGVKEALAGQGTVIQRVSDRQLEAAKEMARLSVAPPVSVSAPPALGDSRKAPIAGSGSQVAELQSLRRDLAVLRQTYSNFTSDITSSMSDVRAKASKVKSSAEEAAIPTFEGDAGRARVNTGKKELAKESERLVARVDDLQDLVEDLRKDVVTRGVRPLPRQLEGVSRDVSNVMKEIKKMQDFLSREKPIWTKIWEKELQMVCEERDQLTMQEDLAADLQDDLEKAAQTFALVEQATKEQAQSNVSSGAGTPGARSASRTLGIDPTIDPMKAKDGVLGEVRALQPNHESRVEAIERAEKARKKELESRRIGLFQKELGNFVQEGKLKKSGGVEEAERLRNAKDDRIRKEVWERQQGINAKMEAAEAAAQAEQKSEGQDETTSSGEAETASEGSPSHKNEESPSSDKPE
ncbi:hypothetical protein N7510_007556 [Penicillium lagena]|uniref:uncharacterized protein n=1 Tax=Penicillium lagena TaxID=94218 RepID=UPI0025424317|nr:uncharacterized protein N7510_007556 [Penicillium lagena]KAJ5610837.1 hypothetical protein N7510_007556 [Penicillium lagena]